MTRDQALKRLTLLSDQMLKLANAQDIHLVIAQSDPNGGKMTAIVANATSQFMRHVAESILSKFRTEPEPGKIITTDLVVR